MKWGMWILVVLACDLGVAAQRTKQPGGDSPAASTSQEIALGRSPVRGDPQGAIRWAKSPADALALAQRKNRPILLVFSVRAGADPNCSRH